MSRAAFLRIVIILSLGVAFSAALEAQTPSGRNLPPYIMIKIDDLVANHGKVHPLWRKVVDYLKGRNIKCGIGIICNSLESDSPEYFQWIKDQHAGGLVEFWNHGFDHKSWEEAGKKMFEFKGPSFEQQKQHLLRCNELAKQKLGFTLPAFGAGFNATDENTVKALAEDPDTKIWLYGDPKNPAGKVVLERVFNVNIENPTFLPDVEKFKQGYAKNPTKDYFVIQGHPTHWNDERWAQFTQIIDFLVKENAVFTTPSEYVKLKKLAK
jgi:peptidoglycan/xylan/chitin deacetylase (PgdA/CDA1 family)